MSDASIWGGFIVENAPKTHDLQFIFWGRIWKPFCKGPQTSHLSSRAGGSVIFGWPLPSKWVPIRRAFGDTNSSHCPRCRPNKLLEGILEGMRNPSFFQGCSGRAPPLGEGTPRFRMSGHIGLQAEIKRKISTEASMK